MHSHSRNKNTTGWLVCVFFLMLVVMVDAIGTSSQNTTKSPTLVAAKAHQALRRQQSKRFLEEDDDEEEKEADVGGQHSTNESLSLEQVTKESISFEPAGDSLMANHPAFEATYVRDYRNGRQQKKPQTRCETLLDAARYGGRDHEEEWYPQRQQMMPVCDLEDDNIRGKYSAHKSACILQFYKVHTEMENESIDGKIEVSMLCGEESLLKVGAKGKKTKLQDYVRGWPDECVGDFQRCYSVKEHDGILWKYLCQGNITLPAGTTHLSVDCRKDKEAKIAALDEVMKPNSNRNPVNEHYSAMKKLQNTDHAFYMSVIVGVVLGCGVVCLCGLICVQKLFFQPYLTAMKKSRSDEDLQSLIVKSGDTAPGGRKQAAKK